MIKKIIGFLCSVIFCTTIAVGMPQMARAAEDIAINETNFPDEKFRNYVLNKIDKDKNSILSNAEIKNAKEMHISGKNISDLKGIEYFTNLTALYCQYNRLKSINLANCPSLHFLECYFNKLNELKLNINSQVLLRPDYLHGTKGFNTFSLSNLNNVINQHGDLTIIDKTKPATYQYHYQYDGDDELINFTIIYTDTSTSSTDTLDDYIVEETKKYTSDTFYKGFTEIMETPTSDKIKLKQLTELFKHNGLTDIKEGVKYLSNTTGYRNNYLFLTTNDIYCAANWDYWLNNTSKGKRARSLLWLDGLIFNYELSTMLDVNTYIENNYPAIQKNKTLLQLFIQDSAKENQVLTNANITAEYCNNLLDINDIATEKDTMKELIDDIGQCKDNEERKELEKQFFEKFGSAVKDKETICVKSEQFSKAFNYASSVIYLAKATVDDIILLLNMSEQLALYDEYSGFLNTIKDSEYVSNDMRAAAKSLLDDMENGYYKVIKDILHNCGKTAADVYFTTLDTSLMKELLKEAFGTNIAGNITNAMSTLKLATFVSNIVVDMGDFVEQAAYTQGYAELARLYSMELEKDKKAFQASQTVENAWKFYEDYNLLWRLRYKGEEQYLDMNTIKVCLIESVKGFDYDIKQELVEDTLSELDKRKFIIPEGYEVPKSIKYCSKTVVNCPVDIDIALEDGTVIASLKDGIESDLTNEYGRFAVVYQPYTKEYAKIICNSTDKNFIIKATATSDGLVNYQTTSTNNPEKTYSFYNLLVKKGDVINTKDFIDDGDTYFVHKETGETKEYTFNDNIDDVYVVPESIKLDKDKVNLEIGETYAAQVTVFPENASNAVVDWSSSDIDVAKVSNGVITAISNGTATIYAKALDAEDIVAEIKVIVGDGIKYVPTKSSHLFCDYNYNSPVSGSAIIYGNGISKTIDGKKVNNKALTVYTDITASYKYTLNSRGIVKPSIGKVIVGVTKSDIKPEVSSRNKITDTSASNIAKARIKNGQITVTSVGKEGGLVYLWVIDTGSKEVSACCPINVKLAPKKLEVQDTSGSKLKDTKLANGNTLEVCIAGLAGSIKTDDCTYTATVDQKYSSYITVTPVQDSKNKFTIKATGLKNNKDTKVSITFTCDQNGKKTKFALTITK